MAYADYQFYYETYGGDVLTEENAGKWLERASDEVDTLTSFRLVDGLPEDEYFSNRIKKAVCAIAECLYQVDLAAKSTAPSVQEDGAVRGAVTSVSSGRESISYGTSASSSVYYKAAASEAEKARLVEQIAVQYLANVPNTDGVNLLYRGARGRRYV